MTIFVTKGDAPLSAAQLDKRTQAYINRDWPLWQRERSIRNNDGEFNAYMSTVAANTDSNRDNNIFNQQLLDYRIAVARLAQYRLADGRPELTEEVEAYDENGMPLFDEETGEPVMETVVVQTAIDPLDATVEQPVYDELTGEQTGTETVPNPLIVSDDAERAAAQAIVDATPQEVKDFD
jgi:hypothetical protein